MRRVILAILFLALMAPPASAQSALCPGLTFPLTPRGYQQLTASSTAVALTQPSGVIRVAVIQVEENAIRYRDDGTNPTATVGTLINPNTTVLVCGAAISAFRAIRQSADAVLSVHYYGE